MIENKAEKRKAKFGIDGNIQKKFVAELLKDDKVRGAYEWEMTLYHFMETVKKEMARKHLSYYAVAKKGEMKHQILQRLLNGQKNAEIATLTKVAHGVGGKLGLVLQKQ